jgi:hypothetical protein
MPMTVEQLEAMVRAKICPVCSDRDGKGGCGLETPSDCALFRLFPQVARAILSTTSDDIRDYVAAIRAEVCSICREQELDGTCPAREEVRCALDAYLIPVTEVIEEATGLKRATEASAPRARFPLRCV